MNHKVNVHSNWNEVRKGEGSNRKEYSSYQKTVRVWMAARYPRVKCNIIQSPGEKKQQQKV